MSTTIDERVVEMRFDNKQFESATHESLSTLQKLKQSLNLTGASKGLDDVNAAAKKVDLRGLGSAVETVQMKFSAMQVAGITALANITNQAVNTGKRIVSALTIDPVKTGLSEYETKMNAVQVIQANTRGVNTMEDITAALDDLNTYADKTIYNFAQMTSNIGKFTAQGFDVKASADMVKGLANLAAASGASAEDMSRATYQMTQAMGSSIKLMDWNSLRNANMATQDLKKTLIALAKTHGIAIDDMIKKEGTFEYTLQNGWLTGEMFSEAMNIYSGVYSDAELKAKGFTESQIADFKDLAATAESAATEVKTMTQLWDVLKETAQSGWTQTWELIFGDFEESKKMFTEAQVFFSDIINAFSDARNSFLGGALDISKPWSSITDKLENSGLGKVKEVAEAVENVTDKLETFQEVVDKVWMGDFGNVDTGRFEKLEELGYDSRVVQDLVNKGRDYKLTVEDVEASHKKFGLEMKKTKKEVEETASSFNNLTDEELRNAGLTEGEIKLYRDLAKEADRTGVSINELVDEMSKNDGRTMLIDSFKNAGSGLLGIFKALKGAWSEIFPAPSFVQLYNLIKGIRDFSENLRLTDEKTGELTETGDKLRRTFKGVFALISIGTDIIGGGFKLAFKAVSGLLKYFDMDILDVTAAIGDAIVKFREVTDISTLFAKGLDFIVPLLIKAGSSVKEWVDAFSDLPIVQKAIAKIKETVADLKDVDLKEVGKNIIEGLRNGLGDGAKEVVDKIAELGIKLLTRIKEILGIHSPSTEFFEIGKNIILGLINGIMQSTKWLWDLVSTIAIRLIDIVKNIDLGGLFAFGVSAGMIFLVKKISDAFSTLAGPIDAFTDILEASEKVVKNFSKVVNNFAKVLGSVKNYINAKALKEIAIAIAILVGSIVILTLVDPWKALAAAGVIVAIVATMTLLMDKLGKLGEGGEIKIAKFIGLLWSLAGAFALFAIVAKLLSGMDDDALIQAGKAMAGLVIVIGLLTAITMIPKVKDIGPTLIKIAAAMVILAIVAKMMSDMSDPELLQAGKAMGGLILAIGLLTAITMIPKVKDIGPTLMKIAGAMLILSIVAKMMSDMSDPELLQAGKAMGGLILAIGLLTAITAIPKVKDVGSTLMKIAGAILILSIVAKIMSGMDDDALIQAGKAMVGLGIIIAGLVAATRLAGDKELVRVGTTLIAMSVAIGILAGVCVILGLLNPKHLAKGIIAVGALGSLMALMIHATKNAQDVKGNLIVMTVAIAVMAAAVASLSFIDPKKLYSATGAMAILMGMFSLMTAASAKATGAMGTLIVMTVALGVMAGIIFLLSKLPIEATIGSAVALSILILALSGSLVLLTACGSMAYSALSGVILLTAMAVPLLAFVGILALMQNVENAMKNVGVLTAFAAALTLLLIPLTLIGAFIAPAAMGVLALTAMAIPLLAFVGILALMQNIENAKANVEVLTTLLTSLTKVMVVLAIIGPMALIGVVAMAGLTALMVGIGALVIGIGALMTKFPELEGFVDKGIPILNKLAHGIGSFMMNALPFINGSKLIDPASLEGIKALAEALLILTGANILEGLTSWFAGEASLADFGAELAAFGPGIKDYADAVAGIDVAAVTASATAAKSLAEMASALPNTGGFLADFLGDNTMDEFGSQLESFGKSLLAYGESVIGIDQYEGAISASVTAAKSLAELADAIPNSGGFLADFLGDNTMDVFGNQLKGFGKSLLSYGESVVGIDQYEGAISASVTAAGKLTELADAIPNSGGFLGDFLGDNTMDTFGSQLEGFGKSLMSYGKSVAGIDQYTGAITASVTAAGTLSDIAKQAKEIGKWDVGKSEFNKFGDNLVKFGKSMADFSSKIKGINASGLTTAISNFKQLANLAKEISGADLGGLKNFGKSLSSVGADSVDKFIKAFSKSTSQASDAVKQLISTMLKVFTDSKPKFNTAGSDIMRQFIEGTTKQKSQIKTAFLTSIAESTAVIRGQYGAMYSSGAYIAEGIAQGIRSKYRAIYNAGYGAGKQGTQGGKDGAKVASPSKEGIKTGKWIGEGLVIGIVSMAKKVYNAGYDLGDNAVNSLSKAMVKVKDYINSDMDTQPTIRPVLDLSDVESGVGSISGLFNNKHGVGVLANVGAISSMVNDRQNGANDDVVSAINKLRKELGNVGSTTYNVNGITYDDGSNISNAVQSLVRAARVERRV